MSFAQGIAALRAGDLGAAERILLAVVEQDATAHAAWHALSVVAVRAGLPDVAIERGRRAVALDRRNADYLNSLGIAYGENEEFAAAEKAFRRAFKIKPAHAQAHYNLATALRKQGKIAESLREYECAHAIDPQSAAMLSDLAQLYRLHGQPERALALLRAVRDQVADPDVIALRAQYTADIEGTEAAIAWLRQLLARHPDRQAAHYSLALQLLSLGRWREGWKHHLWRAPGDRRRASLPADALPERLDGRRVLLRAEHGIGDVLFFLRFDAELRSRGATIALECPPQLAKLTPVLADQIALAEPSASDLQVWIADLPSLLQTEATPPAFSLRADAARCAQARDRLAGLGPPPYLGLTWRAGTDTRRARRFGTQPAGGHKLFKEISPALLGQAVRGWAGSLVSLQREPAPHELDAIRKAAGADVHDLAAVNEDLSEALALLEQLDDYVAVSSTNMHLLAGLGRTARVLVPYPPEWRWMRGEGGSVWFPGFAVYRQPVGLDWSEPLARLREDLFASAEKK